MSTVGHIIDQFCSSVIVVWMSISVVSTLALLLALVGGMLYKMLTNWRDQAGKCAVERARNEMSVMYQAQEYTKHCQKAEEERKAQQLALAARKEVEKEAMKLWEKGHELMCAMYGTTGKA